MADVDLLRRDSGNRVLYGHQAGHQTTGNPFVNRFIVLSFLVMGWGYYELSGGADFVPEARPMLADAPETAPVADVTLASAPAEGVADDPLDGVTIVTRADTEALDALPEAEAVTPDTSDAITLDVDSVADALAQALEEPVLNTGTPEAIPEDATQTAAAAPGAADLREVTGDTVNLRDGPGTNFNVVDRLTRGTVISLLDTGPDGWVYVEIGGLTGWMSSDFLGPAI
jgi:hypothetical protein